MRHVHIVTSDSGDDASRGRRPELPCERGGFRFDHQVEATDGWLVFCHPGSREIQTSIPWSRRVLVLGEPSPLNYLPGQFINQFGVLIAPYNVRNYRGFWFQSHPGLAWHFGAKWNSGTLFPSMSYQQLVDLPRPEKSATVSTVVSNKVVHAGHRHRLRFLEALKRRLGSRLVIFGRGIREIEDKADAILPYAYHLALENTSEASYWTEKLADAYLGYALPIYAGCPDVERWFSPESMVRIDPRHCEESCDRVISALESNLYSTRLSAILDGRRRVLEQETLLDVVARAISRCPRTLPVPSEGKVHIRSNLPSGLGRRIWREVRRTYRRATFRCQLR